MSTETKFDFELIPIAELIHTLEDFNNQIRYELKAARSPKMKKKHKQRLNFFGSVEHYVKLANTKY